MASFNAPIAESITISDHLNRLIQFADFGTVPKKPRALLLNHTPSRDGILLNWAESTDSASTYGVYRGGSIVESDISSEPMAISDGDVLTLKVNGGKTQTITFSNAIITDGSASASEVVDNINAQIVGATAYLNKDPIKTDIYIRTDSVNKRSSIEVVGGNVNSLLNFPTGLFCRNITRTEFQKLGEISDTSFEDVDGSIKDFYYITALNQSGLESKRSRIKSLDTFVDDPPDRIVIFGRIYDSSGNPGVGREVILRPIADKRPSFNKSFNNSKFGVTSSEHKSLTDEDGYFEIEALSSTELRLTIPSLNYDLRVRTKTVSQDFVTLRLDAIDLSIQFIDLRVVG